MRAIIIGAASLLMLTGCGENEETRLAQSCSAVMSDPDVQRDVIEANVTVDDYCACASKQILALPDTTRVTTITALETMETLMAENNGSTEAAFRVLAEARRAENASAEAIATYESVDQLGDQLENTLEAMREAGGTCPS